MSQLHNAQVLPLLGPMSLDEYLDFLDEFWAIFGPPPVRHHIEYHKILL